MADTRNTAAAYGYLYKFGTLEPEKKGDMLIVKKNPLEDISVLYDENNIQAVMKEGRIESTDEEYKHLYDVRESVPDKKLEVAKEWPAMGVNARSKDKFFRRQNSMSEMQTAPFKVDVTPPLGAQMAYNIYLTGCAGNVTFGKYRLGDKEKSMAVLGRRLGRGLAANLNRLEPAADGDISFRKVEFDFPFVPEITVQNMLRAI